MFGRKKKQKRREDEAAEPKAYGDVLNDRLARIGNYTHDYDESERDEVEARIRRMFYGAKVEGSLAERTSEAKDDSDDEDDEDAYGRIAHG
jgi:hypothetical protein